MKIRNGFVSNSSSSSFVLIGFALEKEGCWENIVKNILQVSDEEIEKKIAEIDAKKYYEGKSRDSKIYAAFDDDIYNLYREDSLRIMNGSDDGVGNKVVIGKMLVDGDSYLEEGEYDMEKYIKELSELKLKLNSQNKILLFTGTRSC